MNNLKKNKKKTKKRNTKKGGSTQGTLAVAAASGLAGTYAGNTIQKKFVREGQTWFSHLLFSYLDLVWYLSKTFVKAGTYVYKEAVIYSIDYYFGRDITNVSLEDLTSEVKDKLIKSARLAAAISNDPEAMKNLKESGKLTAEIMTEIMKELEEPLMKLTNKAVDILEGVCLNLTAAGVDIGVGVVGAAAGQIPFLGALINIIIAVGRAANKAGQAIKETSGSAGKFATLLSATPQKPLDKMIDSKEKVTNLFNQINEKIGQFEELNKNLVPTGIVSDKSTNNVPELPVDSVQGVPELPVDSVQRGGNNNLRYKKFKSKIDSKTRKRIMKNAYKRHKFI